MSRKILFIGDGQYKTRVEAFLIGAKRHGYRVIHSDRDPRWEKHDYKFAVSSGLRIGNKRIQQRLKQDRDLNTLVLDLGYLKRASGPLDSKGYNQLSINACGWVTKASVTSDRFERLEMPLESLAGEDRTSVLLCGQVPYDGQHNMSKEEIEKWLTNAYDFMVRRYTLAQYKYIVRPHPLATNLRIRRTIYGLQLPESISSWKVLKTEAAAVVAYNSTMCVEALLLGIPVFCNKDAHFAELATSENDSELKTFTEDQRVDYFNRLAYSQWTIPELRSGEALDFTLSQF